MGRSKTSAPAAPPTAAETTKELISAQIEALPRILESQQEFAPQFTQSELDLLRQFGPEFLQEQLSLEQQFGPELAGATRETLRALSPERIAAQDLLTQEFQRPVGELLTPEEAAAFRAESRAATSVRGLGESGFGALEEVRGLTALRNQLKQQRLQLALGAASGVPTGIGKIGTPQVSTGQLVQNVDPGTFFGGEAARTSALTQRFGTRQQAQTGARSQNLQFASGILGGKTEGGGTMAAAFLGL